LTYYNKALKVDIAVYGENHPSVATNWNNLGLAYYEMKQYKPAEEYLKKALQIREKFLGNDHPYTKGTRRGLEMVQNRLTPKGGKSKQ
jgi:tetratricopeptide (TPR) repeat protein